MRRMTIPRMQALRIGGRQVRRLFRICLAPALAWTIGPAFSPDAGGQAENFTPAPELNGSSEKARPWTDKPILDRDDDFHFILVTDRTGGQRDGVFEDAIKKINLMQPAFVVSVGDLIEGYFNDAGQSAVEWDSFLEMTDGLDMRFFFVPGNHDIWSDFSRAVWEKRFGRSYYHFHYKDVLFLALNSEDGGATRIGKEQSDYFVHVLGDNRDVRWTIVLTHKPLWVHEENGDETGWAPIAAALKGRDHTVFAGHRHQYVAYRREGMDYIDLATTGGGSVLTGPVHGRFDQIVWVTMNDQGPQIANLTLNGIMDKNVRTEESGRELDAIAAGLLVDMEPVTWNSEQGWWQTSATVVNNSDRTVKMHGDFTPHPRLHPIPSGLDLELNAGERRRVPVRFALSGTARSEEFVEMAYAMEAMSDVLGHAVIWEGSAVAALEPEHALPAVAPDAIATDGDLADWSGIGGLSQRAAGPLSLSGAIADWSGPDDLSFRFGVAVSDEFLHVAMDVVDDKWIDKTLPHTTQDFGQLLIAPLDAGNSSPVQIYFKPSADATQAAAYFRSGSGPAIPFAARETPDGYSMEIAIPLEAVGNARAFRINAGITDVDHPAGSRSNLFWRPAWQSSRSWENSGLFRR